MANTQPIQPSQQPVATDRIHLVIRNRTQTLFNDDVRTLTSHNDTGTFDVLPEHANFISLLNGPIIIQKIDGEKQEIPLKNGVIKVKDNTIHCYINLLVEEVTNK